MLDRTRDDIAEGGISRCTGCSLATDCPRSSRKRGGLAYTREGLAPLCAKALQQGAWPADADGIRAWFTVTAEHEGFKPADSSTLEAVIDEVSSGEGEISSPNVAWGRWAR
ncbi:MAG: hypothetical protein ACJZ59_07260 [Candidatus Thalassarchaeaceae archaeon]